MNETQTWQTVVSVILPHPTKQQVIVYRENARSILPQMSITQKWVTPIGAVNAEMQRLFALQTTVLRQIDNREDAGAQRVYATHLLELQHTPEPLPGGLHWIAFDEVDALTFDDPQQQAAVKTCLSEIKAGIHPALRVPWAQPGWQANTEKWIRSQLAQLGQPVISPIEQIKIWFLSCVLCAPTERGDVYFKVTNATTLMVNEAVVTQALAQRFPAYMPTPLAIEADDGWMLLADFGEPVGWGASVEIRAAVLREFARLQIASSTKIDELLAIGCIDRRLLRLAEQIDPLFEDTGMMATVSTEIQHNLLAAAPRLKALCTQLDQYQVPTALVHGDLNMGNVARRKADSETEQFIFFDWTDACLAHPFLDMIAILHEGDVAIQRQLRDAYLTMWLDYEPMERLLEMWQIAYTLCALHQAVSYRYILLANEPADCQFEMAWAMPFWFGKILESLRLAG